MEAHVVAIEAKSKALEGISTTIKQQVAELEDVANKIETAAKVAGALAKAAAKGASHGLA